MIKVLELGEIVYINGHEYCLVLTPASNGSMKWEQPTLKLLKNVIQNNQRQTKPKYYKKFKSLKLTNLKGGNKE